MCRQKCGDCLEFSFDFWGFHFWKERMCDRLFFSFKKISCKIFNKIFGRKKKKPPHWKTRYKLDQYFYASIISSRAPSKRVPIYTSPRKNWYVPLTCKLDRGFFLGEVFWGGGGGGGISSV